MKTQVSVVFYTRVCPGAEP